MPDKADREIRIFFSAGEVSGDVIGASLAEALHNFYPKASIWGLGGGRMKKAGVSILYNTNHMGSVGISESIVTLPNAFRIFNRICSYTSKSRPDVAVLIGYDAFNLVLGRWLRAKKILTISYFPPQIWLWRGLAPFIANSYDRMLTSFINEEQAYRKAGGRTAFVGHYLRDRIDKVDPKRREEARKSLGLSNERRVVGLLPGSRTYELERMIPAFLDISRHILSRDSQAQFVLPVADRCFENDILHEIGKAGMSQHICLSDDSRTAMPACDLLILCSGTVTLEAALMGLPMIILYQMSLMSWIVVNLLELTGLIDSKTVGIPNLLAGRRIVPEFIQSQVVPQNVADEAWDILQDAERQARMKDDLASVCSGLGEKGGVQRAAHLVLKWAMQEGTSWEK